MAAGNDDHSCFSRFSFWLGLAVIAAAFAAGAVLTWRRWPDLIIDFGPQLYMPWRIAEGAVLYRDLFYLAGGPLSQYFHAGLFDLFGVSFLTIIVSNLVIAAAMLLVIYHQFSKAGGVLTASCIALAIVVVFAFAQYTGIGNNNYVAPYSHELLHGLALSVFAIALLARWINSEEIRACLFAGLCLGLVLLTKPDIFVALSLTVAATFVAAFKLKLPIATIARSFVGLCLASALPLTIFLLIFRRTESWGESLRLAFSGWFPVFLGAVVNDPFYQWSLGLDAPLEHLRHISIHFLTAALIIIACAVIFRRIDHLPPARRRLLTAAGLAGLIFLALNFQWPGCGASLPLWCLVSGGLLLQKFRDHGNRRAVIFPLLWSVFALLLLAKQGVFPRIWHTGFALAMPAFACALYFFLRLLPDFLQDRFKVPKASMRLAGMGVLLVACLSLARVSAQYYSVKNLEVGQGADLIFASGPTGNSVEARNMNLALDWIGKNVPPHATLAALPQGAMLNYLSRRANSTPCLDWNPTMLAVCGSTNMSTALKKNPPDYIALVEWQTYEFGNVYFGHGSYGAEVMAWIRANYQPVVLFGSEPLCNGLFGIKILKRRTGLYAPTPTAG